MATITCGKCKGKHTSVAEVQACYQAKKVQTLDDVLGSDVNPDPKTVLKEFFAAKEKESQEFTAMVDATATPAPAKVVPAHRAAKAAILAKAAPAPITVKIPVAVIDDLSAVWAAAKPVIKTGQDLELGMYQMIEKGEVVVYKVEWNKYKTYKLAKKLYIEGGFYGDKPKGKFYYAVGMMAKLTSENKMTEEQAKAFHDATKVKYGQAYGFCCVCGKLLTVKKSIDAGIGPVCATKF